MCATCSVARMEDPGVIRRIIEAVMIPVAKCRIGHFVEAQVLEVLGVDFIGESEVLTPADEAHHVWKHDFKVPFVCGCRDLGESTARSRTSKRRELRRTMFYGENQRRD